MNSSRNSTPRCASVRECRLSITPVTWVRATVPSGLGWTEGVARVLRALVAASESVVSSAHAARAARRFDPSVHTDQRGRSFLDAATHPDAWWFLARSHRAPHPHESDDEAAVREVREETGFDVSASLMPLGVEYEYRLSSEVARKSNLCRARPGDSRRCVRCRGHRAEGSDAGPGRARRLRLVLASGGRRDARLAGREGRTRRPPQRATRAGLSAGSTSIARPGKCNSSTR